MCAQAACIYRSPESPPPPSSPPKKCPPRPQLDGRSGAFIWGEQFGSGADDEAVGLMLGPEAAADAERPVGSPEQGAPPGGTGGNPLYLTGWTRGALFSKVPGKGVVSAAGRWVWCVFLEGGGKGGSGLAFGLLSSFFCLLFPRVLRFSFTLARRRSSTVDCCLCESF